MRKVMKGRKGRNWCNMLDSIAVGEALEASGGLQAI